MVTMRFPPPVVIKLSNSMILTLFLAIQVRAKDQRKLQGTEPAVFEFIARSGLSRTSLSAGHRLLSSSRVGWRVQLIYEHSTCAKCSRLASSNPNRIVASSSRSHIRLQFSVTRRWPENSDNRRTKSKKTSVRKNLQQAV